MDINIIFKCHVVVLIILRSLSQRNRMLLIHTVPYLFHSTLLSDMFRNLLVHLLTSDLLYKLHYYTDLHGHMTSLN